ncbi:MAG: ATP-binding cassette domain-containing protein [Bacteroidales bacterium]|nr:ATP-binding cassette domain-containing protein [Bacteroidales bacterium]
MTKPDRGLIKVGNSIWFDSDAGINKSPQDRNIGFVFQDYALFPNMSVYNNVAYGQMKRDKRHVHELIQKFGLTELAARNPDKLSGGQKQRVALARALARKPDFLLLDEPLSALDADIRTSLQNEILKAHSIHHTTTLLVSHDLTEVFRLAQKVLKIENGAITGMGKPEELFLNNQISGKVQITGSIVKIQKQDTFYLLTVVTGMNQLIKVTAFESDIGKLTEGDRVMVFSKAFSPLIQKM